MNFTGEIHPVAAMFPMLAADELQELADDIKANGQVFPIILDQKGTLIDGRNRLAACKLAGVEPRFELIDDGRDPVAYILATNVSRRHLSKGQRAMAVARTALLKLITNRPSPRSLARLRVTYRRRRPFCGSPRTFPMR